MRHIVSVPAGHSNEVVSITFLDYKKISRPRDKGRQSTSSIVDTQELVMSKIDREAVLFVLLVPNRNSNFLHRDS